jgi:hypothetical protein
MHRGHDHDHHHHGGAPARPGPGHNHATEPKPATQWQTPHLADHAPAHDHGEPDLDLVEAAFVEAFLPASDPTSFLRLARVPFEARAADGSRLVLLRVETDAATDVGSVTPHLGGGSFRYDPLPAKMTTRRRGLRFVYFDGTGLRPLTLAEVRELSEA